MKCVQDFARPKTSSRERAQQGLGTKLGRGWEPGNESGNFGIFLGNLGIFWELTWDFYKITVGNTGYGSLLCTGNIKHPLMAGICM